MPIYEYTCPTCFTKTKELRNINPGDNPPKCKACGTSTTHIIYKVNIIREHTHHGPKKERTPHATIKNCTFSDCNIGVRIKGHGSIEMTDNTFMNVNEIIQIIP